jgi:hypothetical protein
MMLLFLLLLVVIAFTTTAVLDHYGNRKRTSWYIALTAFISWSFPFSIILMLPLDIASTGWRNRCLNQNGTEIILNNSTLPCHEPALYLEEPFLLGFWKALYWSTFYLTWVIIPVLQSWVRSGEFTIKRRAISCTFRF